MEDINEKEPNTVRKHTTRSKYINLLTDFGFKHVFKHKKLLLNFLNAALPFIEGGIKDLSYDDTERTPHSEEERIARFDLNCITGNGERIIIEIQNHSQEFYKDRVIYYITFPIQEQAPKNKDWDYQLNAVYSVNILNFRMKELPHEIKKTAKKVNKYLTYVQMCDVETKELFSDKVTLAFIELTHFRKKEEQLEKEVDKWTYVIKNIRKLQSLPATIKNDTFEELFEIAEIAALSKEDRKKYNMSIKTYRDMNNYIAYRDKTIAEQSRMILAYQQRETEYQQERAGYQQERAEYQQERAGYQQREAGYQQEIAELRRLLDN